MTDSSTSSNDAAQVEAVTHAWERALAAHDVEALVACYATRFWKAR